MHWLLLLLAGVSLLITLILILQVVIAKVVGRKNQKPEV